MTILAVLLALLFAGAEEMTGQEHSVLSVSARPERPFREVRGGQQIVDFDLILANHDQVTYRIAVIRLEVFDAKGRLELRRELNENGKPAALDIVGDRILSPGKVLDIFQPFYSFGPELDLARLHFQLLLIRNQLSAPPVVLSPDETVDIDVQPISYKPSAFCLPLTGLILVHDGHDFYSHHRRYSLASRYAADPRTAVSSNLYAYDFMIASDSGALFKDSPNRKEHWLSYGAEIVAPADGKVIEVVRDLEENDFDDIGGAKTSPSAALRDPYGLSNHVKILHSDGRVSWLLHMQPESIAVRVGEHVKRGSMIGRIGFSGDALFPHLHYTVTATEDYPSQGVPSYFTNFARVLGSRIVRARGATQVDTGDLLRSDRRYRH